MTDHIPDTAVEAAIDAWAHDFANEVWDQLGEMTNLANEAMLERDRFREALQDIADKRPDGLISDFHFWGLGEDRERDMKARAAAALDDSCSTSSPSAPNLESGPDTPAGSTTDSARRPGGKVFDEGPRP